VIGSQRLRAVVVSAERYNPNHAVVAPLRERAAPDLVPAFIVPLSKQDWPVAAAIDLSRMRSLDSSAVAGPAGQLTQGTLGILATAVRHYLGAAE
jgi:hypothetical protein